MTIDYKHQELEAYWQAKWEKDGLYKTIEPLPNEKGFYALSMFPYPSGSLHMGHVRNYVITDVIARYQRMKGRAVLHPMGWDAFGLPAENAAIERGIDPSDWTIKNIKQMRNQLNKLGLSVDWDREITTSNTDYYKWTQYLFLKLHEAGLAYQKKAYVNWDPIDETVLANEQVDSEGKSWRSGALVEQRELNQWFLGITEYGSELVKGIDKLKGWPERVKTMQSNWIGESKGTQISFKILDKNESIEIFTTRPDTLFGVSYLAIALDHPLLELIIKEGKKKELIDFKLKSQNLSDIEKKSESRSKCGFFTGSYVTNPINNEKIPIWIGDYVLSGYGTGAVMGVPAHDKRDFLFAQKYNLKVKYVIKDKSSSNNKKEAFLERGELFNSGKYDGLDSEEAKGKITEHLKEIGMGCIKVQYKLRDWLISRQRYWGCPIPIINCNKCGKVKVPYDQLPVELPKNIKLTGKGKSALQYFKSWVNVKCPICNNEAQRETDTMDTFICSSWYYLRYTDPLNIKDPFTNESINKWLPVDQYVGGIEHAILHLLYSRFITKALNRNRLIDIDEPFKKLLTQGMVQAVTYKNPINNKYIANSDISDLENPTDPITGDKLEIIYEKMSKSKYNGIDPSIVIEKYGADTARMFILFKAPPEKDLEWDDSDVEGQYRFIQRIYKLITDVSQMINFEVIQSADINFQSNRSYNKLNNDSKDLLRYVNQAISNITDDLENNKLNTSISELMILTNKISEYKNRVSQDILKESCNILIRLLAPFSPHISEQLWNDLKANKSVHIQTWPKIDKEALKQESYELVIQINGKVRDKLTVPKSLNSDELEDIAVNTDISRKWIGNASPKRIIVVKGKLVNIVM